MYFVRLQDPQDPRFARAMAQYALSFPLHEQRMAPSQRAILAHPQYQFNLICAGESDAPAEPDAAEAPGGEPPVGALLCWETDDFIYIEHFFIDPALRGRQYGAAALTLLARRGKTVILEIDPPVDEISVRRKGFYERCGYRAAPFAHVHPPYREGCCGHPLVVMSCPQALTQAQYGRFAQYLREVVMGG